MRAAKLRCSRAQVLRGLPAYGVGIILARKGLIESLSQRPQNRKVRALLQRGMSLEF
jgi:hypothetical protein